MNTYDVVTQRMLELLERGVAPWRKTWADALPRSYVTGKPYRGVNLFFLGATDHKSPFWLTYRQARKQGGYVRKGEKSQIIVYWNFIVKRNADGTEEKFPILRYYSVFNIDQCDNVPAPPFPVKQNGGSKIERCEAIVKGYYDPPSIAHGGARAFYRPATDSVQLPTFESFETPEAYYSTLFHELTHSTGHEKRLARDLRNYFGTYNYGKEELVAEFGAAFLCAEASINNTGTEEQSAAYLENWRNAIKEDNRLVVQAASAAQKATNLILGNEYKEEEEKEEGE